MLVCYVKHSFGVCRWPALKMEYAWQWQLLQLEANLMICISNERNPKCVEPNKPWYSIWNPAIMTQCPRDVANGVLLILEQVSRSYKLSCGILFFFPKAGLIFLKNSSFGRLWNKLKNYVTKFKNSCRYEIFLISSSATKSHNEIPQRSTLKMFFPRQGSLLKDSSSAVHY